MILTAIPDLPDNYKPVDRDLEQQRHLSANFLAFGQ